MADSANSASFIAADTTTLGNWKGLYGADGEIIATTPTFSQVMLKAASQTDHIASTYYDASTVALDINFTDGATHRVAIYLLNFDTSGRAETVTVLDAATNAVLDTRSASSFVNGEYLVWNISGHVTIHVACTGGPNAVVSGVFFGPVL